MPHPCDYFVKFVLAQNTDLDINVDAINKILRMYDLPYYKEDSFNELMGTFRIPRGFDFEDRNNPRSRSFMESEKIATLWDSQGDDSRVISDLAEGPPIVRFDLHILLMGGVPADIIADKLNLKHGILSNPITCRMVETYSHYFWNKDRVSLYDWEEILLSYPNGGSLSDALYCGAAQALYRCGLRPKVDVYAAIREVHRQAYFRLDSLRHQNNNPDSVKTFSSLASKIISSHEIMTAQGAGLQDQLKQFRQIMMKHQDPDIKQVDTLINKLEGGSYSGEVKQIQSESSDG